MGGPEIGPCCGVGQGVLGKPADVGALERMGGEFAAGGPAVEHERDERNPGEASALPIEHGDRPHDVAVDPGLLLHFLHHNLGRRIADIGPPGGIQPHPTVGPLHHQQLTAIVADDRTDRDLGRDVAGDAHTDAVKPLLHLALRVEATHHMAADVGSDLQDLLEPLTLVKVVGGPDQSWR